MDFTLTPDQIDLATALEGLVAPFKDPPVNFRGFALASDSLEAQLAEAEFYDIAGVAELGPVSAALTIERLARLPFAAEVAVSMLVRPFVPGQWTRPIAVVEHARTGRFVAQARTLILLDGERVSVGAVSAEDVESVESIYAYPMGRLKHAIKAEALPPKDAANVRKWLRIATASEAAGLMQAAIDATVDHLKVRKQFGRPLGSFQALRHRMAECAVLVSGARWLALKAASTEDEADAALALFQAQEAGTRLGYELHQMLGAMGVTLEHPLHLWTYRLKALLAELGGRAGQARELARLSV